MTLTLGKWREPQRQACPGGVSAPSIPEKAPTLGSHSCDSLTGIEGILIAITQWHDRSDECAIQREGCDAEGKPFEPHWFPISRLVLA